MKVYELINQLKGTSATLQEIKDWSYMNRILPCELKEGLELDCEYPKILSKAAVKICLKTKNCYTDCLNTFFEMELDDIRGF